MRTNIAIDDKLMSEAAKLSQLKTKKAVVEEGLKLLIRIKKQEHIRKLKGKLKWEGDLEKMRLDS
jgi:Arc/MetJ family transcription regulator